MGKEWDGAIPGVEFWVDIMRVCKPGAFLLAFGGDRTHHRLMVAIEDAGWELRTCIYWLFGSGFPKSLDISKAIDKAAGVEREVVGEKQQEGGWHHEHTINDDGWSGGVQNVTAPATEAAKQWDGWGTSLKPAAEIIIVAMKPLEGSFAENAQKHGVAGLNVDGCRVEVSDGDYDHSGNEGIEDSSSIYGNYSHSNQSPPHPKGRWPANVIHDGSESVLAGFPQTKTNKGTLRRKKPKGRAGNIYGAYEQKAAGYICSNGDSGSAARFFYCAKASKSERNVGLNGLGEKERKTYGDFEGTPEHSLKKNVKSKNNHPTVKPVALMEYLCRLTMTPTGGVVLDPFMGSGTTGVACAKVGRKFVGCEIDEGYFEIAEKRIRSACRRARSSFGIV